MNVPKLTKPHYLPNAPDQLPGRLCRLRTPKNMNAGPRANASNSRTLLGSHHGGREKIRVHSGCFAFARDAHFRGMLLEQAQRQLAHQREILRGMALLNPTGVLIETNVQVPMQTIFNAPMTPQRLG